MIFFFLFFLLLLYDLKFFCICAKRLKRKGYFFVHCLSALYSALVLSISLCIFVFRLGGKIPMSVADFIQMRQTKKKPNKQTLIIYVDLLKRLFWNLFKHVSFCLFNIPLIDTLAKLFWLIPLLTLIHQSYSVSNFTQLNFTLS